MSDQLLKFLFRDAPVRELRPGELADWRTMLRARNEAAADDLGGSDVTSVLAPAAFIGNTALLRGRIRAAERSSIWYGCRLDAAEGEIVIGARSNVQDNSVLAQRRGAIRIGIDTTVGHNVALAECTIGNRCLIGIGSRIAPGTVVEGDVFLAAGATTAPGPGARQRLPVDANWGIEAVKQLVELVVCRNRQTGFASQSTVQFKLVEISCPVLEICLNFVKAMFGDAVVKTLERLVHLLKDVCMKTRAEPALIVLHDVFESSVYLLKSEYLLF